MKMTYQLISSYPVLATGRCMSGSKARPKARPKALPKALLVGAISLSVGLAACSSEAPSAETTDNGNAVETTEVAAEPTSAADAPTTKTYEKNGIAIGGADPVAYFEGGLADGEYLEGSADYTHEWQGVTWQFTSAENRDAFVAAPEKYAPQYGGFCAWAVAQDKLAAISPDAWSVVDGKLYLNANKNIQARWEKDIPGFIAKASENWPQLGAR